MAENNLIWRTLPLIAEDLNKLITSQTWEASRQYDKDIKLATLHLAEMAEIKIKPSYVEVTKKVAI
jgi:hypothetical protein